MLTSTSSEFLALCREQIALLSQGLGASFSVVYLTQELVEAPANEAKLIPVVAYPETAMVWQPDNSDGQFAIRDGLVLPNLGQKLLSPAKGNPVAKEFPENPKSDSTENEYLLSGDQIVLPLIHESLMMGLLVINREDRVWNEQERSEIERVAKTIAIACVLDKRRAWLELQVTEQQILQEKQQDLLDTLLHQLRNPLTALRTFGKLLLKRLLPSDPNRETATSIVRESDRIQELLQQFEKVLELTEKNLEIRKLAQKEVVVEATVENSQKPVLLLPGVGEELKKTYVADILQPLIASASAIASERNLELILEIPPNLAPVRVNVKTLREVLNNIIDNALKYTPSGGKIFIQTGIEKPGFQGIGISDTGPGIPSQDLEHLGERHFRGVQAQTEIPGTGLGISIAKELIEQMQGEIQVFSPAINSIIKTSKVVGTTFIVWLVVG